MHCQLLLLLAVYSNIIEAGPVRQPAAFVPQDILPRFNNQSNEHFSSSVATQSSTAKPSSSSKPTFSSTSIIQFTPLGGSFAAGRPSDVPDRIQSGSAQPLRNDISQAQGSSAAAIVQSSGAPSVSSTTNSISSIALPALDSTIRSSISSAKTSSQTPSSTISTTRTSSFLSSESETTSRSSEAHADLSASASSSRAAADSPTSKSFGAGTTGTVKSQASSNYLSATTISSPLASGAESSHSKTTPVPTQLPVSSSHFSASATISSSPSVISGNLKNADIVSTRPTATSQPLKTSKQINSDVPHSTPPPSKTLSVMNAATSSRLEDDISDISSPSRSSKNAFSTNTASTAPLSKTLSGSDMATSSPLENDISDMSSSSDPSKNTFSTSTASSPSALSPQSIKATASNYPDAHSGNVAMAVGYNQIFKSLTQEASCDPTDNKQYIACIKGQPAKCEIGGTYTLFSCPQGQSCYAIPMPSGQSGVNIGCATPSDAAKGMNNAGTILPSGDSAPSPQPVQSSNQGPLENNQENSTSFMASSATDPPSVTATQDTMTSVTDVSTNTQETQDSVDQSSFSSPAASATGGSNLGLSFPDNLPLSASTAATQQTSPAEDSAFKSATNQKDSIPPANNSIPQMSAAQTPDTDQQIAANREPQSTTVAASLASSADAAGITIVPEGATTGDNGFVTVTVTVTTTVHD